MSHVWLRISGEQNCCQEIRKGVVYRLIEVEMDIKDVNDFNLQTKELGCNYWSTYTKSGERGKRDVYCDKQVGKVVIVLNCMLKSLRGEGGSGGIRKKLKSKYAAYLESNYRRNDGSSI